MLTSDDLPRMDMLVTVLNALGCRISIQPIDAKNTDIEPAAENSSVASIVGVNPGIEPTPANSR